MSRVPFTSRDLAALRVAEQRAEQARPEQTRHRAARGEPRALTRLLRRLWAWLEQPEAQAPDSRPQVTHFYTEL